MDYRNILKFIGSGVYFYAITILTQYGYNSYFNIPTNFIESSIRDNIIFSFSLSQIIIAVADNLSILVWISLIISSLFLWFIIIFDIFHKNIITLGIIAIMITSCFGFYNLGNFMATTNTEFNVLSQECSLSKENITYIIPTFYQTTAVITPIYTDSNKLTGDFLTKNTSDLNCEIQKKYIGKVLK